LNWLSLKQFKSSCAVSLFLMNLSSFLAFSKRVQIYNIFFNLQMFLKKFLFFIFSSNLLRFSKRVQNYNFFSKLPNLFSKIFSSLFSHLIHSLSFCGCKGNTFLSYYPNFSQTFFENIL